MAEAERDEKYYLNQINEGLKTIYCHMLMKDALESGAMKPEEFKEYLKSAFDIVNQSLKGE